MKKKFILTLILLGFFTVLTNNVYAETFHVANNNDHGNGSLRTVIITACEQTAGDDQIDFGIWSNNFPDSKTISLDSPLVIPSNCQGNITLVGRPFNQMEIVINGDDLDGNECALLIQKNNTTVQNMVFVAAPRGICVESNNNNINTNFIGWSPGQGSKGNGTGVRVVGNSNQIFANTISANSSNGVQVLGDFNVFTQNYVGTNAALANKGNGANGFLFEDGAADNTVGGNFNDKTNTIQFNQQDGIAVVGNQALRNKLSRNIIARNTQLGIDIGNDGVTANGSHPNNQGPNNWFESVNLFRSVPFNLASNNPNSFFIQGRARPNSKVQIYQVDSEDQDVQGEGKKFITEINIPANGAIEGFVPFSALVNGLQKDMKLSSTVISLGGNTSEFSNNIVLHTGPSASSDPVPDPEQPVAPTPVPTPPIISGTPLNLAAAATGPNTIDVTWTDTEDETGFKLERSVSANCVADANAVFNQIAQLPANSNIYNNVNLNQDTTYCYRVRSFNNAGNSAYSNRDDAKTLKDTDGDGIEDGTDNCPTVPNPDQLDTDGDGIGDVCEDTDGDGIFDPQDNCPLNPNPLQEDADNDGLGDVCDSCPQDPTNTCGVVNACDANSPDADADNICNMHEDDVALVDTDADTMPDFQDTDTDADTIPDIVEAGDNDKATLPVDTDADGKGDWRDNDSDGDSITDQEEAGTNPDHPANSDNNNDGEDFRDTDSDDDTIPDGDGTKPIDNCRIVANPDQLDTDADGQGDACDSDDDNDGIPDGNDNCVLVPNPDQVDTDGDGKGDKCDNDSDGDGVDDNIDNCPLKANPDQSDVDGDGKGDVCDDNNAICDANSPDVDTDTICDAHEDAIIKVDTDGDLQPDFQDLDTDNDSIPDIVESGDNDKSTFPIDTDTDGVSDWRDPDSDNDGIDDKTEAGSDPSNPIDTDLDGKPDYIDTDSDGDGVPDGQNGKPIDNCRVTVNPDQADSDADGMGDACDPDKKVCAPNAPDTDGDIICNLHEDAPNVDSDQDGNPDFLDQDTDNDSISDKDEAGDSDITTYPIDTDQDTIPDFRDPDTDNDGINDNTESGDNDPSTPPVDTDGDGTQDYRDLDSDNDTIPDSTDNCRLTPNTNQADEDKDGIGDACDPNTSTNECTKDSPDTDSDRICNIHEDAPTVDTDKDNTPDYLDLDTDNDQIPDVVESGDDNLATLPVDTDKDGTADFRDPDSDNDNIGDTIDNCRLVPNTDQKDSDQDGIGDACDLTPAAVAVPPGMFIQGGGCQLQTMGNVTANQGVWSLGLFGLIVTFLLRFRNKMYIS